MRKPDELDQLQRIANEENDNLEGSFDPASSVVPDGWPRYDSPVVTKLVPRLPRR